jgi:hypothetical protein
MAGDEAREARARQMADARTVFFIDVSVVVSRARFTFLQALLVCKIPYPPISATRTVKITFFLKTTTIRP